VTVADLPPIPVPRLLVWRHGRTEWNAVGRFQGQHDPPLDERGRLQAERTAPHLVSCGLRPESTVVVSSDLVRALQTAAPLGALLGVPVQTDQRLRETGLGCWEGLTREEVAERHPEQYADWMGGLPVRGRGGEETDAVVARMTDAMADLPPAETAVVVTHGGAGLRLLEALLGLGSEQRRVLGPLGNCAWSELRARDGRWRLMEHNNSAAHLPVQDPRQGEAPAQDADAVT
jgi:probable phosphoglycerate mutase